jgi:hypothetical protein
LTSLSRQLEEARTAATGASVGGGDFSDPVAPGKVRTITSAEDAMEALKKAKKARATAIKERDQATALASEKAEEVAEYDDAISMLEKWMANDRGHP